MLTQSDLTRLERIDEDIEDEKTTEYTQADMIWMRCLLADALRELDEARAEATKFRDLAFAREEMVGQVREERDEALERVSLLEAQPSATKLYPIEEFMEDMGAPNAADVERARAWWKDNNGAGRYNSIPEAVAAFATMEVAAACREAREIAREEMVGQFREERDAARRGAAALQAKLTAATWPGAPLDKIPGHVLNDCGPVEYDIVTQPSIAGVEKRARQYAIAYLNSIEGHLNPEDHATQHFAAAIREASTGKRNETPP